MSAEPWFRSKPITASWFHAKRFGYGAGLPLNWKGWVFLIAFMVLLVIGNFVVEKYVPAGVRTLVRIVASVLLVVPMLWIVKSKTEGGWRWRD